MKEPDISDLFQPLLDLTLAFAYLAKATDTASLSIREYGLARERYTESLMSAASSITENQ